MGSGIEIVLGIVNSPDDRHVSVWVCPQYTWKVLVGGQTSHDSGSLSTGALSSVTISTFMKDWD